MAAAAMSSPTTPSTARSMGGIATTSATPATTPLPPPAAASSSSNTNPSSSISFSEVQYITEGCASNLRLDGRSCGDYRPYTISNAHHQSTTQNGGAYNGGGGKEGPLVLSNGSSRVLLPGCTTDILCSIRAELVKPAPSSPHHGIVDLSVEYQHSGGSNKRSGRAEELEISSILSKLLLPQLVNRQDLCIMPHKYVWRLFVDVLILSCDGCVLDACAMAIRSAMSCTLLPKVTPVFQGDAAETMTASGGAGGKGGGRRRDNDFLIDGDITHALPPPGVEKHCPVIVTVSVLTQSSVDYEEPSITLQNDEAAAPAARRSRVRRRQILVIDTRSEEEACASSKVTVSVDPQGNVCGVHKHGGKGTLTIGALGEITGIAVSCSKKVLGMMQQESAKAAAVDGEGGNTTVGENMLRGHFELR
uniref:Ribosomal RNA-processing protein 42 n=1 Tax=Ditylum brightwellii TaxID=49249 RepID=A0A7S4WFS9_9STRA